MIDSEIHMIACCLFDDELIDKALAAGVKPDWFTDRINRSVWQAMIDRHNEHKTVDIVWANNFCRKNYQQWEKRYTDATLSMLSPSGELMSAIEIMQRDYRVMKISELINIGRAKLNSEEPSTLINEMLTTLRNLQSEGGVAPREDLVEIIAAELDRGIDCSTGFHKLDYSVKGIEPGVLWVVGGSTSHGKTTLVLNIAYNHCNAGYHTTIFSTEMSEKLLLKRIATMLSGVNPSISASLTKEEKSSYMEGVHAATSLPLRVQCTLSLPAIRMEIRKRQSELYVVDYIQMVNPGISTDSEVRKLGHIARELERLSKEYDVCIIATSQFSRTRDEAPTLASYRGSGEIEENTDIGLLMYYPYQQATFEERQKIKDEGKDNVINVEVSKNRIHGLTDTIKFTFDRRSLRMQEMPESTEDDSGEV